MIGPLLLVLAHKGSKFFYIKTRLKIVTFLLVPPPHNDCSSNLELNISPFLLNLLHGGQQFDNYNKSQRLYKRVYICRTNRLLLLNLLLIKFRGPQNFLPNILHKMFLVSNSHNAAMRNASKKKILCPQSPLSFA